MRSVFICTTLVIVVSSVFSQRPIVRYSENLKKAVPHHYNHDQENADRGMDKIAGGHKIGPHQPPLRPQQDVPWLRWVHEGRWAAQADKNSELHRVRARLLEEKLKPNHFAFKPHVNPQLKPKLKQKENGRTKRDAENTEVEKLQMETEIKVRHKRDIMMPQLVPELIMQPHFEAKIPQPLDQFNKEIKESEKREKRQILYFINKPPLLLARSPRTTPNPFIRDTHIEDYDIIRPEVGEREGMIPTVESGSSDLGSYPLVSETSDLEYESDYTISMSDSEEWHNYPLTTPSGPNPGWQLSTLADIYQKQRRNQNRIMTSEKKSHSVKTILRVWPDNGDRPLVRSKRSPKERKRKIGAYKEKIKQRRKVKDMKKKRRIIRNSKEDKAVKEDLKDEKAIERLLERPRVFHRQTAYQVKDTSREILWSNGTHNIVEDKGASVKWINETHYIITKDKDNLTEEWYNQHHVLCYNEEWENKTSEEKRNATIGAEDEDEEDEDLVVKEVDKKPSGKGAVKKKIVKRKGRKGESDKKAPKPKKKSKNAKKILTVKNVNEEPKDPRRDPRERKMVKKSMDSVEDTEQKKKKDKKVKTEDEKDTSETKKEKKKKDKKIKKESEKDEDDSSKKRKRKKSKTSDLDGLKTTAIKKEKREKDKKTKDSHNEEDSNKTPKSEKEKNEDREKKEKKKKSEKRDKSSEADVKKKRREKKSKGDSVKKDKEKSRKKRSIYRTEEANTAEVRWEKVQKSEYDGYTIFGGQREDKSEVYDASYELIETRNITNKPHHR